MSMDEIARKDAVITVTTTIFVTPSLETVANVLMVIKMQNVIKASFNCNIFYLERDFKKQKFNENRVNVTNIFTYIYK